MAAALSLGAPAAARGQTSYAVTVAARACPSYASITANLARNDFMESLRDLGPASPYTTGDDVDPAVEQRVQPECTPLPRWRFTFGRNGGAAVGGAPSSVGPWGSLSAVAQPFDPAIVTQDAVPLLDATGRDTGASLAGAATVRLTQEQLNLASNASLWIQGGSPADPVLDRTYPGRYGFGALRCAIDNLNGDNVERIGFPLGATHVFCFAYYVTPPPDSGTIVIRKVIDEPGDVAANTFAFGGNLSYNPGGAFTLTAAPGQPASETFVRAAGGAPWVVDELVQPGWAVDWPIGCDSASGASAVSSPALSTQVSISLAHGDTVTCTYVNRLALPTGGLLLGKATLGGTGEATFRVNGEVGASETLLPTELPDVPAYRSLESLPAGDYQISEAPVERPGGRWVLRDIRCGGRFIPPSEPLRVTVPSLGGVLCVWTNEFQPSGAISVRKVMTGATGTTSFAIRPLEADPPVVFSKTAAVTREDTPVTATGDATDALPIGTYEIQETTPSGSGSWRLESVICNGIPVGSAQGRVRIRITAETPRVTCTFSDRYSRTPPRAPELGPRDGDGSGGGGGGTPGRSASPLTNLQITKSVMPTTIVRGQPARYTVVLRNRSGVAARDVVIEELQPPSSRPVSIEVPRGVRCRSARPLRCVVGTLGPRRTLRLRATYTTPLSGRVVNRVAVHTATRERRLTDNRAHATLRVVSGRVVGCAAFTRC